MSHPSILSCENIVVSFDGFKALQGMNLNIEQGEIRFLIGPDGAGKTTMLDVICGKTKAASGSVRFQGEVEMSNMQEHEIVGLGIARKFQAPSIFHNLSVFENLELSMKQVRSLWSVLRAKLQQEQWNRIMEVLEQIGLTQQVGEKAGAFVARTEAVAGNRDANHPRAPAAAFG